MTAIVIKVAVTAITTIVMAMTTTIATTTCFMRRWISGEQGQSRKRSACFNSIEDQMNFSASESFSLRVKERPSTEMQDPPTLLTASGGSDQPQSRR